MVGERKRALEQCGLRATRQRVAVYDWLLEHPVHPTAEEIWKNLLPEYPTLSLTTVYNTVKVLATHGLIRTVNAQPEELRFDGNPADHGHFCCSSCGALVDFMLPPTSLDDWLPPGTRPVKRDLLVTGLCAACAAKL